MASSAVQCLFATAACHRRRRRPRPPCPIPPRPTPTDEQAPQGERLDEEQVHQVQHHGQQRKPQQAVLQALHAGVVQQLAVGANLRGPGSIDQEDGKHMNKAQAMNRARSCRCHECIAGGSWQAAIIVRDRTAERWQRRQQRRQQSQRARLDGVAGDGAGEEAGSQDAPQLLKQQVCTGSEAVSSMLWEVRAAVAAFGRCA